MNKNKYIDKFEPLTKDLTAVILTKIDPTLGLLVPVAWEAVKVFVNTTKSITNHFQVKKYNEFLYQCYLILDLLKVELNNDENISNSFSNLFLAFMAERNPNKRQMLFRVFKGIISSEDRVNFQLEKMFHFINLLSIEEIEQLVEIAKNREIKVEDGSVKFWHNEISIEKIIYLNSLGLLIKKDEHVFEEIKHNNYGSGSEELRKTAQALNQLLRSSSTSFKLGNKIISKYKISTFGAELVKCLSEIETTDA